MNEDPEAPGELMYLTGLARRLQSNREYMAWALREYGQQERLDESELAGVLNLSRGMWIRLSLCKRPDPDSPAFADQVRQLSEYVSADAGMLVNLLRQIDSLSALRDRPPPQPDAGTAPFQSFWRSGLLAAARDRPEEYEAGGPGDRQQPDDEAGPGHDG
jgi:hypothetical protein